MAAGFVSRMHFCFSTRISRALTGIFRTDPTTIDIVLVNEDLYPPVTETVASGVDADKGSYTIKAHNEDVSDTDTGCVIIVFELVTSNH